MYWFQKKSIINSSQIYNNPSNVINLGCRICSRQHISRNIDHERFWRYMARPVFRLSLFQFLTICIDQIWRDVFQENCRVRARNVHDHCPCFLISADSVWDGNLWMGWNTWFACRAVSFFSSCSHLILSMHTEGCRLWLYNIWLFIEHIGNTLHKWSSSYCTSGLLTLACYLVEVRDYWCGS